VVFARRALPQAPVVGWLIGLLWLLSGYPARPDRLAMVGGFVVLAFTVSPLIDRPRWFDLAAGVGYDLCVATSVPTAVAFGPLLAGLCLGKEIRVAGQRLIWMGLTALAVAALICLPVYFYDSWPLQQNLGATVRITQALGFLEGFQQFIRLNPFRAVGVLHCG